MKFRPAEQGSIVHIILVVVLVLSLLGALSFIFYQNFIEKQQTTKNDFSLIAESQKPADEDAGVSEKEYKTFNGNFFSIDYPTDTEVQQETFEGYAEYVTMGSISIAVFDGTYIRGCGCVPSYLVEDLPTSDWYIKQGKEHSSADENGLTVGSLDTGAYSYKVTRYRGQTNDAVVYVFNNNSNFLYEISVQEGNGAELLDSDEDGNVSYDFSSDVKRILASFKMN